VAVGEFLFELTRKTLLDFVEAGEQGNGHEDDNGFFAVADFDLDGGWSVRLVVDDIVVDAIVVKRGLQIRSPNKPGYKWMEYGSLPHEQRRIVVVSGHSSNLEYWFRVRRGHWRCWSPAQTATISSCWWQRSC
jgi:hypothetical protein